MQKLLLSLVLFAVIGYFNTGLAYTNVPANKNVKVQKFINEMQEKHNFNKDDLQELFANVYLRVWTKKELLAIKKKPKKKVTWSNYRSIFITDSRINDGVKFWQKYQDIISKVQDKFGVSAQIIVAILGIETNYGKNKGNHDVLSVLTRKAFGNYSRVRFYKRELENFLLLSRENSLPPLSVKGSYAGAIGYSQFMPSSYRYYALDFNNDGKVDIINSPEDAIASIANYLLKHKWQKNSPLVEKIPATTTNINKLATTSIRKPKKTIKYWHTKNINTTNVPETKLAKIIKLSLNNNTYEYWLIYWNFYAITRYNHDNKYAMATYQLSEKIKLAFDKKSK